MPSSIREHDELRGRDAHTLQDGHDERDAGARTAPYLVNRNFSAEGPDELWVADITHVRAGAAWLYLAVMLDVWSWPIVGWAMAPRMPAELVGDALTMEVVCRQLKGPVIHQSDQGSQYTSLEFGQRCREAGVVQSMGSVGDAYDNAMCESFSTKLDCEFLDRRRFRTVAAVRLPHLLVHAAVRHRLFSVRPSILETRSRTSWRSVCMFLTSTSCSLSCSFPTFELRVSIWVTTLALQAMSSLASRLLDCHKPIIAAIATTAVPTLAIASRGVMVSSFSSSPNRAHEHKRQ